MIMLDYRCGSGDISQHEDDNGKDLIVHVGSATPSSIQQPAVVIWVDFRGTPSSSNRDQSRMVTSSYRKKKNMKQNKVVELSGLRAYQAECAFVAPKTHFN